MWKCYKNICTTCWMHTLHIRLSVYSAYKLGVQITRSLALPRYIFYRLKHLWSLITLPCVHSFCSQAHTWTIGDSLNHLVCKNVFFFFLDKLAYKYWSFFFRWQTIWCKKKSNFYCIAKYIVHFVHINHDHKPQMHGRYMR